ncbi:MAG: cytochrome c oxidase accessory protein CcoG [Halobacteriovoraceae bacterium]|nr:cytochrome c oxidase accessory protein CcoG [Halobacteriovoraceae bacterium]|tara:strand:+ start:1184 stop:2611 length:1428 start_codon:yes stop_codon:yes gene_type:complete
MNKNRYHLHEERLASTDDQGHRVYIHPEDVTGFWRTQRTKVYWFLILIYLVLPWINWDNKQIVLLNIPLREFTFFGTTFYAHDAPLILLVLLGFVFTMGFITSIWGRVWCGWACPQTVFIDTLFLKVEKLIEGKSRARQKLDSSPISFEKVYKKSLKWLAFTFISLVIAHSFLGYFVGARNLLQITLNGPSSHPSLFILSMIITGIILFDFGWFREQFCIIACPYGRFQSVMMDENSLVVAYDSARGEPRRGLNTDPSNPKEGDCINCYHCVKACPTGIDIRRGTQLECIACTNCIDACDTIMTKINKPKGLIRYDTENNLEGKESSRFGIRSGIYLFALITIFSLLAYNISKSGQLKITLIRGTGTPYRERILKNGQREITNLYKMRLDYKEEKALKIDFRLKKKENRSQVELISPARPFQLHSGRSKTSLIHFRFSPHFLKGGNRKIELQFYDIQKPNQIIITKEVNLVGPLH